jgi:hypothetical protein
MRISVLARRRACVVSSAACVVTLLGCGSLFGQTASALIRESEPLSGTTVSGIDGPGVNGVNGYAFPTTNGDAIDRFYGNATGGALTMLRQEGTFGTMVQTAFEGFFGISDSGSLSYGPTITDGAFTGLDAAWIDNTKILNERDPMPTIPGQFSTFNSDPQITYDGTPYWVGGYAPTQGGTTANRALFKGVGATRVIGGGDMIPAAGVAISTGGGPGFGVRMSATGTNYIMSPDLDGATASDTGIVVNGDMISRGGSLVREGTIVPASVGGNGTELWGNFDAMAVNELGDVFFTGDTNAATAADEFVFLGNTMVMREGQAISTPLGAGTVLGDIEWGDANERNDWAVTWDVTVGATNLEALIVNGSVVLMETQLVDWNGDGVIDAGDNNGRLADFTSARAVAVGEQIGGFFDVYFTADIDFLGTPSATDDLEGGFRIRVAIPEPASTTALAGLIGAGLMARRRTR